MKDKLLDKILDELLEKLEHPAQALELAARLTAYGLSHYDNKDIEAILVEIKRGALTELAAFNEFINRTTH